ncbi:cobalt-precorrin-5B (C(1))-methyltransferase [Litorilinea aerophila]|uniref:Cobalt-precorrin-5B C(1)-methyltransferase n=1 Tax=Litorilinea aerophila TaxID=1204385 RepID=A0A540VJZ9_9CHLR|nr:cobalt-precorrin-5B (C(1))-methyltransferase [Litorilinea aerophila]MCC9075558.1 cobalt-precorrin-5B (C(1))-methyltransferase [Litorilinea aerophila]
MSEYPVPPRNRTGQRTGYTTGSNAAAAAKAATIALLTGRWPDEVTITLPIGETATMTPVECRRTDEEAYCCMVKDAGDDPDVTHGALICARVRVVETPGIHLKGGPGVGRVTLPGLGLEVGGPAINPVPRQQICANVRDGVEAAGWSPTFLERQGLEVEISVPAGEELARRTLNPRLGIVGGISILGTTGKVYPYSTAAWRASVIQAVEVAAQNHVSKLVLTTGGRSERFAMQLFPDLPEVAFVQVSVFTGDALKTCVAQGVAAAAFVGMIGKMIKTAQGHMTTHVAGNQVDLAFLAQICRDVGAPPGLAEAVEQANTGRHFLELCQAWQNMAPVERVVALALEQCTAFVQKQGGDLALETILVDFDGTVLARARHHRPPRRTPARDGSTLVQRLAADPGHAYDDDSPLEEES